MKNKMNEYEFIQRYREERKLYEAWGSYLLAYIEDELKKYYIDLHKILKIPSSCRTKDEESLIEKAFYRDKHYANPYDDITDKVGIRFVVMLEKHVDLIGNIIESSGGWLTYSKDQDFNVFRETTPEVFTYQSKHYVVKNKNSISIDEHTIPQGTPCEIQIRTLGQHAYAEISHDLFYKKESKENGIALRYLARTAAFNEESDELFGRLYEMAENKEKSYSDFMIFLKKVMCFPIETDKLNRAIYDNLEVLINKYNINIKAIETYLSDKGFIIDAIKEKQDKILFRQPIVIVLYYLIDKHGYELSSIWDFQEDILDQIKTDLGIAMD